MNRNGNETESFAGNFVASDEQGLFFEVTCSLLLAFVPHLSPTPSSRHRASGHHRRRRSAGGYSLYALSVPVALLNSQPDILIRPLKREHDGMAR